MKHNARQIEYPIVTHCNLKCENCDHLVPYVARDDTAFEVFSRDVDRIAELFDLKNFWLIGGEPTLHPEFDRFVAYAADKLPVSIVTNGLRLLKMNTETLRKLVDIRISAYPELGVDYTNTMLELSTRLAGAKTRIETLWLNGFFEAWASAPLSDEALDAAFGNCRIIHEWKCYTVRNGLFSKCCRVFVAGHHAERINYPVRDFSTDTLNLYDPDFIERLPSYLDTKKKLEACRICNGTPYTRIHHRQLT